MSLSTWMTIYINRRIGTSEELKHNYFCNIKFGRLLGRNQFMKGKTTIGTVVNISLMSTFRRIKNWINSTA